MPNNTDLILAIDLGTSGPKVALVNGSGQILAHAFRPVQLSLSKGGAAEQDPLEWWEKTKECAKEVLSGSPDSQSVIGVACTSQWSGTVAVDHEGKPLAPAMIWMDSRGSPHQKKLVEGWPKVSGYQLFKLLKWIQLTGGAPAHSGKDSLSHILFLKNERAGIYQKTSKFLEPKDFLNFKLTGKFGSSPETMTLHWVTDNRKISNVSYSDPLMELAGIDRQKLPSLKKSNQILGRILPEVASEFGLKEETQVVMGCPDLHSALIGSGAIEDFDGHLYLGTSSWLTCHVPYKKLDIRHNMTSLPSALPGRYFIGNEQGTAGACIQFLKRNLAVDTEQELEALASASPPGSRGLIFTPWLTGERTPVEDPLIRSSFFNFGLDHHRSDFARSVFEGVALNSRWLLQCVEGFIKKPILTLRTAGGGAQSDFWCQVFADVLNREILQIDQPILTNLRGMGLLAMAALGRIRYEEISSSIRVQNRFKPRSETRQIYDSLFDEFLRFHQNNRESHHRLSGLAQ